MLYRGQWRLCVTSVSVTCEGRTVNPRLTREARGWPTDRRHCRLSIGASAIQRPAPSSATPTTSAPRSAKEGAACDDPTARMSSVRSFHSKPRGVCRDHSAWTDCRANRFVTRVISLRTCRPKPCRCWTGWLELPTASSGRSPIFSDSSEVGETDWGATPPAH